MHAMSARHTHHHFQHPHSPTSPYLVCATSPSSSSMQNRRQDRSPSPYTPYFVTHLGQPASCLTHARGHSHSRSRSPMFAPSVPAQSVPALAPAPSPISIPPTPRDEVVMTSTINFSRDTRDRFIINQYLIGHRLGNGQHGEVYKGLDMRRGNMLVAIKACRRKNTKESKHEQLRQRNQGAIPRSNGSGGPNARPRLVDQLQNTEKKVLREIAIMKKCKHGQIVQLYEVINDRLTSKILLVMEYMGGGEVKWRDDNARPCLRVDQTRRICRDVVLGLLYLHHQGIIHRDIKPANLLWTADRKNVKITDFGVSHFSAAQRIDALRHSGVYREALERRKRKKEEAAAKRKAGMWRGRGSRDDMKGKGRAREDFTASSPVLSDPSKSTAAPASSTETEVLESLIGDLDPILLDEDGLSRQAGTPSFLAPEIVWEFGAERTAALRKKLGAVVRAGPERDTTEGEGRDKGVVEISRRDGGEMDKAPPLKEDSTTPRPLGSSSPDALDSGFIHLGETQSTIPDPDPTLFYDPNVAAAATAEDTNLDLPPRPSITKAIDVWALGVTLYCLLFGRVPWGGVTEFAMYQMVHTDDIAVDETMGYDRVPTGGRVHAPDDGSEGGVVIRLLDRLLEKDCSKRITLDEVKRLPWITRDIPNVEAWLAETSPFHYDPIDVTTADEDVAMSTVKFRWWFDVAKPFKRFRSLFPYSRRARQQQTQQLEDEGADRGGYYAEPEEPVYDAPQRAGTPLSFMGRKPPASPVAAEAGLTRKSSRSKRVVDAVERGVKKISRHSSTVYGGGGDTPRSLKRRTLPDLVINARSRSRDGSRSRPASRASGHVTPRVASGSSSNLTSPSTAGFVSDGDIDILDEDDERAVYAARRASEEKRTRQGERERKDKDKEKASRHASLLKILDWRPKASRTSLSESASSSGHGKKDKRLVAMTASASARSSFAAQRLSRRSADEFGGRAGLGAGSCAPSNSMGLASADQLTSAMRASSWGDVADEYGYDFGYAGDPQGEFDGDGASENYGYGEYARGEMDDANDEVRLVGAGGVLSHPVSGPSSPSSLSGVSVGPAQCVPADGFSLQGCTPPVLPFLQTQLQAPTPLGTGEIVRGRGASVGSRQFAHHAPSVSISSPLAQTPLSVDRDFELELELGADAHVGAPIFDDGERAYLGRRRASEAGEADRDDGSSVSGERVYGQGSMSFTVDVEVEVQEAEDDHAGARDEDDEDEGSSDEEPRRLEVRRRRPSESLVRSTSRVRHDVDNL